MSHANDRAVQVPFAGPTLLGTPLLNKGTAFTAHERDALHLRGLLPQEIETIEQQAARAYQQYQGCNSDLDKHILLRSIQDSNETLFYRVVDDHLDEMLPIIYTPRSARSARSSRASTAAIAVCLSASPTRTGSTTSSTTSPRIM